MSEKSKFEVKVYFSPVEKRFRKDIFIDGKLFDYEVDKDSLIYAQTMGPEYYAAVQKDIEKHFQESLSDFLGRKIVYQDIISAYKTGLI